MKLIIFDMDGTILNTLDDICNAVNVILKNHNMPTHTVDEVKYYVGNGLYKTLERAVPEGTAKEIVDEMFPEFIEYYKKNSDNCTRPYEKIVDAIKAVRAAGYKTAVASNKRQEAVEELCEKFFADCFNVILGDREGINLKPAPDMVNIALDTLGIDRADSLYIGDSDVDLLTAKNSEIPVIAVTWGFRGEEFLKEHGAEYICKNPADIPDFIKKIEASL